MSDRQNHSPAGSAAHPIMFWLLTGMAMVIFAPCVLVPIWAEVQAVREYQAGMESVVAELQGRVDQNEARIQALLTDPLVNERIARRELNYQPTGEQVVRWRTQELSALRVRLPDALQPVESEVGDIPPGWAQSVSRWLPAWPWQELFAKPANRSLLLMMAGGLLIAAFLLYGRRPASSHR